MKFKETITKICEICDEEYKVNILGRRNKYCNKCKIAVQKVQAQMDHAKAKAVWESLDEEEQLRRMDLCAKKLLEREE